MYRTFIVVVAVLASSLIAAPSQARGRHHHHHYYHHHHRYHHGHRACDGVTGCLCGVTAARINGLPLDYRGYNLKMAVEFKRALPRISAPVPGAIVYQTRRGGTGHVSTIRQVIDHCTAIVQDDRGTYQRRICGRGATYLATHG